MKKKLTTILSFCFFLVLFSSQAIAKDYFTHKSDKLCLYNRKNNIQGQNIPFSVLFNYPEKISIDESLSENLNISISSHSTNPEYVFFDGYYQSSSQGEYIKVKVAEDYYGIDTITVKISFDGIEAQAFIISEIAPLFIANDDYNVFIGNTKEFDVLKNEMWDFCADFFDLSAFEIITPPFYGTATITENNTILYSNKKDTPNYTDDYLYYRVGDFDGNFDTAKVSISIFSNPYVTKVFDYLPAPGQFINQKNPAFGDTAAPRKLIESPNATGYAISLGGYGGYLVVGFDQPIIDNPYNPYGVDFTVVGNAFINWSEPAAVQVMKDENGNGLPDDTWYELAGSEYYFDTNHRNLTMTYINPKYNGRHTVAFKTNKGFNGALLSNAYHEQIYYPDPYSFNISIDSVSYTGTYVKYHLDKSDPSYVIAPLIPAFGYADNHGRNRDPINPTNPYGGCDGFDLSWAVDSEGKSVELDTVHFVRIYSASQEDGGALGEVSPEILQVVITKPDSSYIQQDYWLHTISAGTELQMCKGSTQQLKGLLFKNGIPQQETAHWSSSDESVIAIDPVSGFVSAVDNGEATITFYVNNTVAHTSVKLEVVELERVVIDVSSHALKSGDTIFLVKGEIEYIHAEAIDNRLGKRKHFLYEDYNWYALNETAGTINNAMFTALDSGTTKVIAQSVHYPELSDTIFVVVKAPPKVTALENIVYFYSDNREGTLTTVELFKTGYDELVTIISMNYNGNIVQLELVENDLTYEFIENVYGEETITFTIETYGEEQDVSMVFIADDYAPTVANPIADISVVENTNNSTILLEAVFSDADNNNDGIVKSVKNNSNETLITAFIQDNELLLLYTSNITGNAEIVIEAQSNGKTITDTFLVSVIKDIAPIVVSPIADITVIENASDSVISLNNVFTDKDNNDYAIKIVIKNNSNEALVTASIMGNELTLSFAENTRGKAEIIIEAESNGKTITDTFIVTITYETAIENVNSKLLVLYPNPSNGIFRIQTNTTIISISIYETNGKLLYKNRNYNSGELIDIRSVSKGNYIMQIKNENYVIHRNIIKQ